MTWIAVLLVLGALFLMAEIILPGGIVGTIGFILLLVSAVMIWIDYGAGPGLVSVVLILAGGVAFIRFQLHLLRNSPLGRRLILHTQREGAAIEQPPQDLVGQHGVALSPLNPVGKIRVADKVYEARSIAGRLPAGARVAIVRIGDFALEVREIGA